MLFSTLFLLTGLSAAAVQVDGITLAHEKKIKNVDLSSAKVDSTRIIRGHMMKEIPASIEVVKQAIINFDEKCNNEFKNRRKHTDKTKDCKYSNKNLVESVIVKKTNYSGPKEPNEVERYVVTRYIYNRGAFAQNDLMVVFEYQNAAKEKVFEIKQYMLSDDESKKYLDNPVKRESAFKEAYGHFVVTAKGPSKTLFEYEYIGKTDHWFLNKDVMIGQVYDSVALGIADLFYSVETEAGTKTASN